MNKPNLVIMKDKDKLLEILSLVSDEELKSIKRVRTILQEDSKKVYVNYYYGKIDVCRKILQKLSDWNKEKSNK